MLSVFKVIHQMNSTHRYSNVHLSERENVLEHTGSVVLLCTQMLEKFRCNTKYPHSMYHNLVADTLRKAAIHDLEETVLGDVVRPLKYHSEDSIKVFKSIEKDSAKSVLEEFGTPGLYEFWEKDKDELSGLFVRVADTVSVVYKVYAECVRNGSFSILRTCTELVKYLEEIKNYIYKFDFSAYDQSGEMSEFFLEYLDSSLSILQRIQDRAPVITALEV